MIPKNKLLRSGVYENYMGRKFDDGFKAVTPLMKKSKVFLQKYYDQLYEELKLGKGLFVYGSNGTGKTLAGSILVEGVLELEMTAKLILFRDLVDVFAQGWSNTDQKIAFNDIKKKDFLVIDDITKLYDRKMELATDVLDRILRYREARKKIVVITSNKKVDELKEVYGDSIVEMIYGLCVPVPLVGKSFRSNQ